jgi:hypothetical protein
VTSSRTALVAGLVLLVLFAALYLFTLDNGLRPGELEGGDLITHQYAQVQGRFSNAPGYPIYTMGGWLWFHAGRLIFGPGANPIPILSSYSTLWALIALALLYALCVDAVGRRKWPIAFLVTAFFGLTYFFWYYAVTTEQYTSSVSWTLAVTLLAFRWERARRDAYLLGLAFLMGVGLAHQLTVLAILPPLVWFVLSLDSAILRRDRLILALVLLAALPLLSYAFVFIRGAQHPEWRGAGQWSSNLAWFLSFVSTSQGRGELTWSFRPFFTAEFTALIWREMTWPGLVAGLAGLAALGRRRAVFLYTTVAIYLVFCWIDRFGNWYQVIMPVYALLALGLAAGAGWLLRAVGRRSESGQGAPAPVDDAGRPAPPEPSPALSSAELESEAAPSAAASHPERSPAEVPAGRGRRTHALYAAILVALLALALYRGVLSYPRADASNRPDDTALAPAWVIVAGDPPQGGSILGTLPETLALNYLSGIWGVRPDLKTITSREAAALLPHETIAVTRSALPIVPAEVSPEARYSAIGGALARISTGPSADLLPGLSPWTRDFGGQLRLLGGKLTEDAATGERVVLLNWLALRAPEHDWSVSVRLSQGGQQLAQQDHANPVWGAYPTTRWLPGEVVGDAYSFALPPGARPDELTVILYRPDGSGGFVNLDVATFPLGG